MVTLVCGHPHCNAEATDEVVYPRVRWHLCPRHADIEHALVAALRSPRPADGEGCGIPGCCAPVRSRGLCRSHYDRAWRRGLLDASKHDRRCTADERREQAALALRTLPGVTPELALPVQLADQPAWVQTAVRRRLTDAWAGVRQELHRIAGVPL